MNCANCQHAKTRVGLLGRWVFCARFHTAVTVRCADYQAREKNAWCRTQ